MQQPRIPPHPTTKQEILFLRRMGFPAQKKMKKKTANWYEKPAFQTRTWVCNTWICVICRSSQVLELPGQCEAGSPCKTNL